MTKELSLVELIKKGGIVRDIPGNTTKEVLTNLISALHLPHSLNGAALLQAVLERESLMPTSIGKGIAVPHPRNPLVTNTSEQFAVIGFLEHPIDWQSLDNIAVETIILIVSSSAKDHLHTLSCVHFFCQQESFCAFLKKRASEEEIIRNIAEIEKAW
jgi:PTS system nitrogen regulatory IIA component